MLLNPPSFCSPPHLMASCASPLHHQPSPSHSSSSPSPFHHNLLNFAMPASFSSPTTTTATATAAAAAAAHPRSLFSRSALTDLLLPTETINKHSSSSPPSPSPSPSSSRVLRSVEIPLSKKKPWANHLSLESLRNEQSKENRENYKEGTKENEQVEQGRDVRLSGSILKRKRPAKLDIPQLARLASFGKAKQFELPQHEASSPEFRCAETETYGVCAKKGRKELMEDSHLAVVEFQGKEGQAFFGVFDGHGGHGAATFAAENLDRHISMAMEKQIGGTENMEDAMKDGYKALDLEFLAKNASSGACSLSVLLKDGHIVVANAGDCKAVLCRAGKAEALNTLHRASNAIERQRIQDLGGYVDCFNGIWRLQSTLAVTRGFGDANLKEWVSAEPEVRQLRVSEECEFLILATDGLWDKVNDQEAVDCAREVFLDCQEPQTPGPACKARKLCDLSHRRDMDSAMHSKKSCMSFSSLKVDVCKQLIHKACARGNLDDITVVIVPLQGFVSTSS